MKEKVMGSKTKTIETVAKMSGERLPEEYERNVGYGGHLLPEIAHMTGQELDPVLGIDGGPDLVLRIEDGLVPGIGEGPDLVPRIEEGPDPAPKIGILVSEIERDLGLDLVLKTGIEIATVEDLDQEIGEGPDRGIGVQDLVPGKSGILILMTGKEGIDQEVGGVILKNAGDVVDQVDRKGVDQGRGQDSAIFIIVCMLLMN